MSTPSTQKLTRFAWLSIGAAVLTIGLKMGAYWLTNSVSLLSDALESLVNLVTAIIALIALTIASRPADDEFTFGYSKIEFFSSGFEGGMILIAAGSIVVTAIPRLIAPQPLEQVGLGLIISTIASLINLAVSRVLTTAGKRYDSITLQADAHHLMTDVITTGGVLVGVGLVSVSGWERLDPLIAILVAANILRTGFGLIRQAGQGLMDKSLPAEDIQAIQDIFREYDQQGIKFHALRTRSAAARRFISMHILVPGEWSVQDAHHLAEQVERQIRQRFPKIVVFTHVEPLEDPNSWADSNLDRD
jgi:cation diffusion facilitator family transporter